MVSRGICLTIHEAYITSAFTNVLTHILSFVGTMRLGSRDTIIRPNTLASKLYSASHQPLNSNSTPSSTTPTSSTTPPTTPSPQSTPYTVSERHRHRYEVNPLLVPALEASGLIFSGKDETGQRMEIIELSQDKHPYFIGSQFHPEFNSRPLRPAPMFLGLLQAIKLLKETKK